MTLYVAFIAPKHKSRAPNFKAIKKWELVMNLQFINHLILLGTKNSSIEYKFYLGIFGYNGIKIFTLVWSIIGILMVHQTFQVRPHDVDLEILRWVMIQITVAILFSLPLILFLAFSVICFAAIFVMTFLSILCLPVTLVLWRYYRAFTVRMLERLFRMDQPTEIDTDSGLTKQQIDDLRSECEVKLDSASIERYGLDKDDCSICLEEFKVGDDVIVLKGCGHVFHSGCLVGWLGIKNRCPLCKAEVILDVGEEEDDVESVEVDGVELTLQEALDGGDGQNDGSGGEEDVVSVGVDLGSPVGTGALLEQSIGDVGGRCCRLREDEPVLA